MGTTTKMAIPYPEATGLVKDGWEDMKDIATQVDAKSGLVLLNTTTFSGVSSQSINDVFSANYDNYLVIVSGVVLNTSSASMYLRLRASGADNTSAQYAINYIARSNTTLVSGQTLNGTFWDNGSIDSTYKSYFEWKFSNVFKSEFTTITSHTVNTYANGASNTWANAGATHGVASSFTGFTIYPSANTFSGVVSTYGINK